MSGSGFKHFFSPPPVDSVALRVSGIGVHERMPPCRVQRPGGTGDVLLMVFHDPVLLEAEGARREVPAGTFMPWPGGAGHDYGSPDGPWDHSWIHCDGERVRAALAAAGLQPGRPVLLAGPERFARHLEGLYAELTGPRPDAVIAGNLLENALRDATRDLAAPGQAGGAPERLLALRQDLARRPQQAVRLADLARAARLSVPHLSALWRRHFGVSPVEDVIRLRVETAKYLLLDQNRRVSEVAAAVGIPDPFRFSRLFRARTGLAPRAWRAAQVNAGAKGPPAP